MQPREAAGAPVARIVWLDRLSIFLPSRIASLSALTSGIGSIRPRVMAPLLDTERRLGNGRLVSFACPGMTTLKDDAAAAGKPPNRST